MNDYIKREDVLNILERLRDKCGNDDMAFALNWASKATRNLSPADVVERKRGEWIEDDDGYQICSECGAEHHWCDYRASFCEDCGAEMVNGGDEA